MRIKNFARSRKAYAVAIVSVILAGKKKNIGKEMKKLKHKIIMKNISKNSCSIYKTIHKDLGIVISIVIISSLLYI